MTARMFRTVLAAATLAAGFASAAQAQTASIRYHQSELKSVEGQRRILKRIANVAGRACPEFGHLVRTVGYTNCVTELSADMVRNVKSAELTAMYSGAAQTQLANNTH